MNKEKGMKYLIIVALLIIPFMYSFFYLKAFWDPYGKMDNIKVALVNLDGNSNSDKGKEIITNLENQKVLDTYVKSEKEANEGLKKGEYYAVITIPENFTETLDKISSKDRTKAYITYSPNQKSNYLASQIINKVVEEVEKEVTGQINENIVSSLEGKLNEVPDKVKKIEDGVNKIGEGTNTLYEGSNTLNNGLNTLNSSYTAFDNGITSLKDGSNSLNVGIKEINNGLNSLSSNLNLYTNNVSLITSNINDLSILLNTLNTHPEYIQNEAFKAKINEASVKLNYLTSKQNGISMIDKISSASNSLNEGVNKLKDGSLKLVNGSNALNAGLNSLKENSLIIKTGINELSSGSVKLNTGLNTLNTSIKEAGNQIKNERVKTEEELKELDGLSKYAKDPVEIKEKDSPKVSEYGTAFAPYFMSISLWVGSLMLFVVLYYDVNDRFKLFSRNASNKKKRTLAYIVLSIVQAVVLGIILKLGIGYNVTNYFVYFTSLIFTSITFTLIMEFLIVRFNDIGKFLAILLLVLQLSSSAGTFPIETVPSIFRSISPFMPATYTIRMFKESLITLDMNLFMNSFIIIFIIAIVLFGINFYHSYKLDKENK